MKKNFALANLKNQSFIMLILSFLLVGLIIIANSTAIYSNNLYGSPYKFTFLQIGWILIGLICFFVFYKIDYHHLSKFSKLLFYVNLGFLVILAVAGLLPCGSGLGIMPCINGANRWIYLNPAPLPKIPFLGVLGLQPGELAKLSIILFLSFRLNELFSEKTVKPLVKKDPFWNYLIICLMYSFLILLQPNMSTASMIFLLGTSVYFSSGASLKKLISLAPVALVSGIGFIVASPYRRSRLLAMFSNNSSENINYHVKQILIALGNGGLLGVGFGASKQKYQYLPEIASDSIFAVIGEEFGFMGTLFVILAFSYLIYKGFQIAKKAPDFLGSLLAVGITSWIGLQFLVNIAAMTKLIPLTGVPLPLISYGGSSMVFSLAGLGILANINSHEENKA